MAAEPAPDTTAANAPVAPAEPEPRHLQPVPVDPGERAAQPTNTDGDEDDVVEIGEDTEPDESDEDEEFADESDSRDLSDWIGWARDVFSPQSGLWTTRPLAPAEVIDRARHGQQLADAGPLRSVSTAYGYASAGVKLPMRAVEWVFCEHLARAAVALVLLGALCLYPPTATALGYALTPLVWAHDLLT